MEAYPVDAILDNSCTEFDLYIDLDNQLVLYAKSPYRWTRDELHRLLASGHKYFFYSTLDRAKVDTYQRSQQRVSIDTVSPPRQRIMNLTDAAAELTRVLYQYPLTRASLDLTTQISTAMVACISEDRTCITALTKLARHDDYTYYHSARVTAYGLAIAMQLGQHDVQALQDMATGCLLHDIGKSRVDRLLLHKAGALTQEEWAQMRMHPQYGSEMVAEALLTVVARSIILHHHERFDGTGYPHQLTERELLEETKIAAFVDIFDALTTNRPYQVSRTPFEALDFIRHKLAAKVHQDSFQAMVDLLGQTGQGSLGSFS